MGKYLLFFVEGRHDTLKRRGYLEWVVRGTLLTGRRDKNASRGRLGPTKAPFRSGCRTFPGVPGGGALPIKRKRLASHSKANRPTGSDLCFCAGLAYVLSRGAF